MRSRTRPWSSRPIETHVRAAGGGAAGERVGEGRGRVAHVVTDDHLTHEVHRAHRRTPRRSPCDDVLGELAPDQPPHVVGLHERGGDRAGGHAPKTTCRTTCHPWGRRAARRDGRTGRPAVRLRAPGSAGTQHHHRVGVVIGEGAGGLVVSGHLAADPHAHGATSVEPPDAGARVGSWRGEKRQARAGGVRPPGLAGPARARDPRVGRWTARSRSCTRADLFEQTVASTAEYLEDLWPAELDGVAFEIAGIPAEASSTGLARWRVLAKERKVILFRLPIERLARLHKDRRGAQADAHRGLRVPRRRGNLPSARTHGTSRRSASSTSRGRRRRASRPHPGDHRVAGQQPATSRT